MEAACFRCGVQNEGSTLQCCGVRICVACRAIVTSCPRCDRPHPSITTQKKTDMGDLENVRVVQRKLVYVVGLSPSISSEETLKKPAYFGQYGCIKKCVVNKNSGYKHGASYSFGAYITFEREEEAAACILAVDGFQLDGRVLKASLGTTKYCTYFLRRAKCPKSDCLFLHTLGSEEDTLRRDEITNSLTIAPNTAALTLTVSRPDGVTAVFPPVRAHMPHQRRKSDESGEAPVNSFPSPQRHMSMDVSHERPPRKNSRYDFAAGDEEEASLPSDLSSLVNMKTLLSETTEVPPRSLHPDLSPLLAPNSPDKDWVLTVMNNRKRSSSGVTEDMPQASRLLFSETPPVRTRSSTGSQSLV